MTKHTILFLAANPVGTDRLALDEEARAIRVAIERSGHRNRFELVTRWAARPLDLLEELRKLRPTVVHFSGHGGRCEPDKPHSNAVRRRDVAAEVSTVASDHRCGLFFQGSDGRAQLVSTAALEETFGAAGSSVKLVVLSACYSEVQAEALRAHVDCVVGMGGSVHDDAARSFAVGFYGGLGERESVAGAFQQGCAAIRLEGHDDNDPPQLKVRAGADATGLVLAAAHEASNSQPIPEAQIAAHEFRNPSSPNVLDRASSASWERSPSTEWRTAQEIADAMIVYVHVSDRAVSQSSLTQILEKHRFDSRVSASERVLVMNDPETALSIARVIFADVLLSISSEQRGDARIVISISCGRVSMLDPLSSRAFRV